MAFYSKRRLRFVQRTSRGKRNGRHLSGCRVHVDLLQSEQCLACTHFGGQDGIFSAGMEILRLREQPCVENAMSNAGSGEPKLEWHWCNKCSGPRKHELRHTQQGQDGDASEDRFFEGWTDSLWTCRGCESSILIHEWEMHGAEGVPGAPQPEVQVYPKRSYGQKQPKYFIQLPSRLSTLYNEVIDAFNSGSMLLCTIGLRALIEGVCNDKGFQRGNLEKKIDHLSRFFTNRNVIDYLHGFRFAGNGAAHELDAMYPTEASHAIEVMEDLLNFLYEFDYKASQLKSAFRRAKDREKQSKQNTAGADSAEKSDACG